MSPEMTISVIDAFTTLVVLYTLETKGYQELFLYQIKPILTMRGW